MDVDVGTPIEFVLFISFREFIIIIGTHARLYLQVGSCCSCFVSYYHIAAQVGTKIIATPMCESFWEVGHESGACENID